MSKTEIYVQLYNEGHKLLYTFQYAETIIYHSHYMQIIDYLIPNPYIGRIFWDLGICFEQFQNYSAGLFCLQLALEYWVDCSEECKQKILKLMRFFAYQLKLGNQHMDNQQKASASYVN